ncbi:MAG: PEP-CTERM sorting domain-containing protein [Pirellulales bacterium]
MRRFWAGLAALAVVTAISGTSGAQVLIDEDFEGFQLKSYTSPTETSAGVSKGDGTDWTDELPAGWSMTFSGPLGNPIEFQGWRIMDVDSWIATEGNQERGTWTRGGVGVHGSVILADGDAYDDGTNVDTSLFNSYLKTPTIDLATLVPGSVVISFDSFWRNEVEQIGVLDVTFDDGANWTTLKKYDSAALADGQVIDEQVSLPVNNPGSGKMAFRFGYILASNDWWFAVDNVKVQGQLVPEPAAGVLFSLASLGLISMRRRR